MGGGGGGGARACTKTWSKKKDTKNDEHLCPKQNEQTKTRKKKKKKDTKADEHLFLVGAAPVLKTALSTNLAISWSTPQNRSEHQLAYQQVNTPQNSSEEQLACQTEATL